MNKSLLSDASQPIATNYNIPAVAYSSYGVSQPLDYSESDIQPALDQSTRDISGDSISEASWTQFRILYSIGIITAVATWLVACMEALHMFLGQPSYDSDIMKYIAYSVLGIIAFMLLISIWPIWSNYQAWTSELGTNTRSKVAMSQKQSRRRISTQQPSNKNNGVNRK